MAAGRDQAVVGDHENVGVAVVIVIAVDVVPCAYPVVAAAVAITVQVPAAEYVNVGDEESANAQPVPPALLTEYVIAPSPEVDPEPSDADRLARVRVDVGDQDTDWTTFETAKVLTDVTCA